MNDLLQQLEANIDALIAQKDALARENLSLKQTIESQRQELIRTHEDLAQLQRQNKTLTAACALASQKENREETRRQLNKMLYLVDKAIEQLSV